ncbi:cache domain-containing sensor histidine kinase [Paenibacillus faecalis]|uniref:cache domain-containing sensor histidine kinase n=1 Tax=Paenibacillus faecalis TaxID=2079532 RepID=UPI000D0F6612|nr:sensor histidine kinase [Paenibacillus faecalis]
MRILHFIKKQPIKLQLWSGIIITVVITLVTLTISYWQTSKVIYEKNSQFTDKIVENIEQSINSNVDSTSRIMTSITFNESIQQFLVENNTVKKYELHQQASAFLTKINTMKSGIRHIILVGKNGNSINLTEGISTRVTIKKMIDKLPDTYPDKTKIHYLGFEPVSYEGSTEELIFVGTTIVSVDPNRYFDEEIGHLILLLEPKSITPSLESMRQDASGDLYIVDSDNTVLTSSVAGQLGKSKVFDQKKDDIVFSKELPFFKGKIVSVVKSEALLKGISDIRRADTIIFMIVFMFICVQYIIISRNITQPVRSFVQFISRIKMGKMDMLQDRIQLEGYAEITLMAHKFNQLLDEIDSLTKKLLETSAQMYQVEISKKETELNFLKSQVNPHFLYNTLETIQGISAVRGQMEIAQITRSLSRVFKYSIKGEEEVLLQEEMEQITHYLYIQQVRFEDRVEIRFDLPDEVLAIKVGKMILQPIVENAFIHGVERNINKTELQIMGRLDQRQDLVLIVQDNGIGMDEDQLAKVRKQLSDVQDPSLLTHSKDRQNRIGLANVHKRIRLTYGEPYGVTLKSKKGKGTEVILRLPGRKNSDV